jgi:hypothetical protein
MDRVKKPGRDYGKGIVVEKDDWNVQIMLWISLREMRGRNIVFCYHSYVVEIKSRRISCLSISFKCFHASRQQVRAALCKPCREEVRSFLGNKVRRAFQRQAICGDDIRSCNFRLGKPEKSLLKQRRRHWVYEHLRRKSHSCTCNLELQRGDVSMDGEEAEGQSQAYPLRRG